MNLHRRIKAVLPTPLAILLFRHVIQTAAFVLLPRFLSCPHLHYCLASSVCVSLCLCLSLSVSLSVCVSLCLCLSLSVSLSVCVSLSLCLCLSLSLSVSLSVYVSLSLSIYLTLSQHVRGWRMTFVKFTTSFLCKAQQLYLSFSCLLTTTIARQYPAQIYSQSFFLSHTNTNTLVTNRHSSFCIQSSVRSPVMTRLT